MEESTSSVFFLKKNWRKENFEFLFSIYFADIPPAVHDAKIYFMSDKSLISRTRSQSYKINFVMKIINLLSLSKITLEILKLKNLNRGKVLVSKSFSLCRKFLYTE